MLRLPEQNTHSANLHNAHRNCQSGRNQLQSLWHPKCLSSHSVTQKSFEIFHCGKNMYNCTIVVIIKQSNWERHKLDSVSKLFKVVYSCLFKLECETTSANGTDTQRGCSSCSLRLTSYHRTRKSQFPNLSPISNRYQSCSILRGPSQGSTWRSDCALTVRRDEQREV